MATNQAAFNAIVARIQSNDPTLITVDLSRSGILDEDWSL